MVRIQQDFPEGAPNQNGGTPSCYLAKICRKLHENVEHWTESGVRVQNLTM